MVAARLPFLFLPNLHFMLVQCLVSRYRGCRVKFKRMIPLILSALTFPSVDYSTLEADFKQQQQLQQLQQLQQQPPQPPQPPQLPLQHLLPTELTLPLKAINLVKFYEGLKLSRYFCPSGKLTIGYGHTGKGTRKASISKLEAEELLNQDLLLFQKVVRDNVKVPLTTSQFGALVSFSFNVGEGSFRRSTLLKLLNQKKYSSVPPELLKWTRDSRKRVLPGLVKRRKAESVLFMASEEIPLHSDN